MDSIPIDERSVVAKFKENNHQAFFKFIEQYESYIAPVMRFRGYRCVNTAERTVQFTFGEVTFSRTRWYKGKKCRIPVDEKLGLEKNIRYSRELLYQVAKLSNLVPYRKVPEVVQMMYQIYITKDTVHKAVQLAADLLEEREDYRFFQEEYPVEKIKAEVIFVEGDGLWLNKQERRQKDKEDKKRGMEFSHFVVHTGSKKVGKDRYELQNKKEISSRNNHKARERLLDYIYNHYEITEDTVLITNSDGGKGYSPYVFKELAKALKIKRHEHFWDEYHVLKDIGAMTRRFSPEFRSEIINALKEHKKSRLKTLLDTMASFIDDSQYLEKFLVYQKKFLKNFAYTKSASMRGLSKQGVGIIESQHRKLSYRMKKRGMYWTERGADAMTQMILLSSENSLRDLFFGGWRDEYKKYKEMKAGVGRIHVNADEKFPIRKIKSIYKNNRWKNKLY